jgi:hypothetical protein
MMSDDIENLRTYRFGGFLVSSRTSTSPVMSAGKPSVKAKRALER